MILCELLPQSVIVVFIFLYSSHLTFLEGSISNLHRFKQYFVGDTTYILFGLSASLLAGASPSVGYTLDYIQGYFGFGAILVHLSGTFWADVGFYFQARSPM